jgi:hypothetical protein
MQHRVSTMAHQIKSTKKKALFDLESSDCRWPIGDPRQEGFHFCGAKKTLDRPYCLEHWGMSFIPTVRSRGGAAQAKPAPLALPTRRAA